MPVLSTHQMSAENESYAYFTVTGSFDPESITERVGTKPTESWRQGGVNPRNGRERQFSRWSIYSRLPRTALLEAHVEDVLDQLDANAAAFKQISTEEGGIMELVGYFHSYFPGLGFESETIRRLSNYGLSMDCDFYYLYSD